jgi:EpsI family protein
MMATPWRHYWVSVALLAVMTPLPRYIGSTEQVPLRQPLSDFGYEIGEWRGHDEYLSDETRSVLGTSDVLLRQYVDTGGQPLGLYVSYFPRQQRGEISHSPKNCLPGAGWQPRTVRSVPYPLAGGETKMINEIVYERNGRAQLVFYWFRERGRIVASEYAVKWYLIWDAIARHRTDGALLRVSAPVVDSEEATRTRCVEFMRLALPQLDEFLPN